MAKQQERQYSSLGRLLVIGNVLENNVKVENNVMKGKIVVKHGDDITDVVTVEVYSQPTFKTGSENKGYFKTLDALNNLVTLAQATDENPASTVIITGGDPAFSPRIGINKYWNAKKEEFNSHVRADLGFGTIEINNNFSKEEHQAEFTVDIVPVDEVEVDEDGLMTLKGAMVDYQGGVQIIELVTDDDEIKENLEDLKCLESVEELREICESNNGETIDFDELPQLQVWGSVSLANIEVKSKRKSKFGGTGKTKIDKIFTSTLTMTGGEPAENYDVYALLEAYDNTEEYEAKLKQKAESRGKNTVKSKGITKKASGFKSTSSSKRRGNF